MNAPDTALIPDAALAPDAGFATLTPLGPRRSAAESPMTSSVRR